jgi:hypothetical protein|tara:strand:- start:119 stop:556 length:438 start_codon:yes stop_codon:yes gene_type:complete
MDFDFNTVVGVGTLIATGFTAIGLITGVQIYKKQMNAQLFIEYTKRYEKVLSSFPPDALQVRLKLTGEPPKASEETSRAVLRYLNLCSEEFYLCKQGYLSKNIWKIWEEELNRTLRSPLLKREWNELNIEFEAYPEFRDYVNQMQ